MEDTKGQCFVMQPFDRDRYDRLYEQIFDPAIRSANLIPYRVDNDPGASVPIETIEQQITNSVACFAEISEDNPNVWFELGYAIARDKPLCLVCSTSRTKFPFDVQHRKIITYPAHALPKDYDGLKDAIKERLVAVVSKEQLRRENAEVANTLAVIPETLGLNAHELTALILIFEEHYSNGISPWSLLQEMQRSGYIKAAANIAVSGLIRKNFVVQKRVEIDYDQNTSENFFVTNHGEDWLLRNQNELNLRRRRAKSEETEVEITDDDIPF